MALASLAAASLLPIAAAATARCRVPLVRRGMASFSSSPSAGGLAALPARVGVVQMTSVGDLDANYATCSRLTKEKASECVEHWLNDHAVVSPLALCGTTMCCSQSGKQRYYL
ncbi:hypothetical protein E2562_033445 [Oryza meyeriana var. granulata]|uniref:Uncharacterized protein n=1 Tax=Oryza meyeriana var. granulata TaxID=110450 RepID=A0A6G1E6N5_9ORYZ|nr:hypothetical protein E2562_033445 [Oryza meyeriana var. granulata]